jgi:hypothetical protein
VARLSCRRRPDHGPVDTRRSRFPRTGAAAGRCDRHHALDACLDHGAPIDASDGFLRRPCPPVPPVRTARASAAAHIATTAFGHASSAPLSEQHSGPISFFLRAPTGLAVGLARTDVALRRTLAAIRPWPENEPLGPPFPPSVWRGLGYQAVGDLTSVVRRVKYWMLCTGTRIAVAVRPAARVASALLRDRDSGTRWSDRPMSRVPRASRFRQLAIARILEPHVAEVVLAHAKQVGANSHARVKTDRETYAGVFCPG